MKNLKKIGKTLSRSEQKEINGGIVGSCPPEFTFSAAECISCGGSPQVPGGNGCCLG